MRFIHIQLLAKIFNDSLFLIFLNSEEILQLFFKNQMIMLLLLKWPTAFKKGSKIYKDPKYNRIMLYKVNFIQQNKLKPKTFQSLTKLMIKSNIKQFWQCKF